LVFDKNARSAANLLSPRYVVNVSLFSGFTSLSVQSLTSPMYEVRAFSTNHVILKGPLDFGNQKTCDVIVPSFQSIQHMALFSLPFTAAKGILTEFGEALLEVQGSTSDFFPDFLEALFGNFFLSDFLFSGTGPGSEFPLVLLYRPFFSDPIGCFKELSRPERTGQRHKLVPERLVGRQTLPLSSFSFFPRVGQRISPDVFQKIFPVVS